MSYRILMRIYLRYHPARRKRWYVFIIIERTPGEFSLFLAY